MDSSTAELPPSRTAPTPFVLEAVRRGIAAHPDRTAISAGPRVISYRELGLAIEGLRCALIESGARPGGLVGIYVSPRWLVIPGMLACIAAGHPFIPLDPTAPVARLAEQVRALAPVAVICSPDADTRWLDPSMPRIAVHADNLNRPCTKRTHRNARPALDPEAFATVYFTSGSTGRPKPIAGRLIGVDAFVQWEIEAVGVRAGHRVSQLSLPTFDGFLKDVLVPLCAGGTVCVPLSPETVLAAGELVGWLEHERIDVLHLVPSMLRQLLDAPALGNRLSSLKAIVLAGEPVLPKDVQRLRSAFGDRVTVFNLYGPTETTLTKLCHVIRGSDEVGATVPIGRPMPGSHVHIVDDQGCLCPPGAIGEIWIATPYAALGYLGLREETAARFVADPCGGAAIAYRTGDLGRLNAQGECEFVGRIDNQLKVRGVRIEPEEIEAAFGLHEAVRHAAVTTRSERGGEVGLVCYCVLRAPVHVNELWAFAAERLPRYMLPSSIEIVATLPRTGSGKLDRRALLACEPVSLGRAHRAAEGMEAALVEIFCDVLGLDDVDPTASFFVLGGHSLSAVEVLARIYNRTHVEVPLRDLFQHSSAALLARHVENIREAAHA